VDKENVKNENFHSLFSSPESIIGEKQDEWGM
jgi:hypothetical protein